eukprot:CAMPEP_0170598574 /NCGR_PEP_ID=MMETSP0224-20130122/16322_1 /TAXON_ID=285029 /ORGANISM="Togula jolla, Strain CCCM 725" /LENGTH=71 /DNA_ID=CAMNT_0010923139 /DNA_START=237 /DNA_END=452 /DNA_ORIENTATION=+
MACGSAMAMRADGLGGRVDVGASLRPPGKVSQYCSRFVGEFQREVFGLRKKSLLVELQSVMYGMPAEVILL